MIVWYSSCCRAGLKADKLFDGQFCCEMCGRACLINYSVR